MNKEIKFKGKSTIDGSWKFGYYWKAPDTINYIREIRNSKSIDHTVFPNSVCQFLLLQDVNGKDVYDKDIYRNLDNGLVGLFQLSQGVGGLQVNCMEWKDGELWNNHAFARHDTTNFEVIDNIIDNSELVPFSYE